MPIYEYACNKCQDEFELLIRGAEKPSCPTCGNRRLEQLMSDTAAHTKGGSGDLPICEAPSAGTCGLPGCGPGGCQM